MNRQRIYKITSQLNSKTDDTNLSKFVGARDRQI